jgi:hypothetical protein
MKPLSELFEIEYGHSLEYNRLEAATPSKGIPFVSRQRKHNGIVGYVKSVEGVEPNAAGELTCALNGQGGVMSAFLQEKPYYTAFHVACLRPRSQMTRGQKLYYCSCIWANHGCSVFNCKPLKKRPENHAPPRAGWRSCGRRCPWLGSGPESSGSISCRRI